MEIAERLMDVPGLLETEGWVGGAQGTFRALKYSARRRNDGDTLLHSCQNS